MLFDGNLKRGGFTLQEIHRQLEAFRYCEALGLGRIYGIGIGSPTFSSRCSR